MSSLERFALCFRNLRLNTTLLGHENEHCELTQIFPSADQKPLASQMSLLSVVTMLRTPRGAIGHRWTSSENWRTRTMKQSLCIISSLATMRARCLECRLAGSWSGSRCWSPTCVSGFSIAWHDTWSKIFVATTDQRSIGQRQAPLLWALTPSPSRSSRTRLYEWSGCRVWRYGQVG